MIAWVALAVAVTAILAAGLLARERPQPSQIVRSAPPEQIEQPVSSGPLVVSEPGLDLVADDMSLAPDGRVGANLSTAPLIVGSDHIIPLSPLSGVAILDVVAGASVYWASSPRVSASVHEGTVAPGDSATFSRPVWLLSDGARAMCRVSYRENMTVTVGLADTDTSPVSDGVGGFVWQESGGGAVDSVTAMADAGITVDNTDPANPTVGVTPGTFAPLASPTFTGTPKVPTAASGTNTTQAASTAFIAAAIDGLAPVIENVNTVSESGDAQTIPASTSDTISYLTLTDDCALTFPDAEAGVSFLLALAQDATGGRAVTWPDTVKWPSGTAPTLTSTASKTDVLSFICVDGTNWLGFVVGQAF